MVMAEWNSSSHRRRTARYPVLSVSSISGSTTTARRPLLLFTFTSKVSLKYHWSLSHIKTFAITTTASHYYPRGANAPSATSSANQFLLKCKKPSSSSSLPSLTSPWCHSSPSPTKLLYFCCLSSLNLSIKAFLSQCDLSLLRWSVLLREK